MRLNELNTDVLLEIVKHLSAEDIICLRKTCHDMWSLSQLRAIWHSIVQSLRQSNIPLAWSRSIPIAIAAQETLEKVALRTSLLQSIWTGPSPASSSITQFPSSLGAASRDLFLQFTEGGEWLIVAHDARVECWHVASRQMLGSLAASEPVRIEAMTAKIVHQGTEMIVVLRLVPRFGGAPHSMIWTLRAAMGDSTTPFDLAVVDDERFPMNLFWGVGAPEIRGDLIVTPLQLRNEASVIYLHDWSQNRKLILQPHSRGPYNELAFTSQKLVLFGRTESGSSSLFVEEYAIPPLADNKTFTVSSPILHVHPESSTTFETPESMKDWQIKISDIVSHTSDRLSLAFFIVPITDGSSPIIRYDYATPSLQVGREHAPSISLSDSSAFGLPLVNGPRTVTWVFYPGSSGKRALLGQKARYGPGAKTVDRYAACSFDLDESLPHTAQRGDINNGIRRVDVGLEFLLQGATSIAFEERLGLVAYSHKNKPEVCIAAFLPSTV
ncbi:hypothetical protein SISSUDRAFT_1130352 [Sistotremastrum suecicum HHB10207 ss-3]|uniref:F-box domain-containing protein n=1 Tax=Sistotremastrum suecicum HHB10207 ss-3 TaxID=1314776 RepID=A0A166BKP4_9AGAM|nr:hypothetical protein SISSUDRAFT_1130352 [Sistotremastrum suecicum HHB10207 ss-3]